LSKKKKKKKKPLLLVMLERISLVQSIKKASPKKPLKATSQENMEKASHQSTHPKPPGISGVSI